MPGTRRSGRVRFTALSLGIGLFAWSPPAFADGATDRVVWVIDGDTFRLAGGERIRIAGIDAPESRADQAQCPTEVERGRIATRKAVALLKGKVVSIERVGRSFGRTVAHVTLNGRDLGQDLVARGVAKPWPRDRPKPGWCG